MINSRITILFLNFKECTKVAVACVDSVAKAWQIFSVRFKFK